MGEYFGTDGFRGVAGESITAEHAFKVGRFLGWYFGLAKGKKCRAVIGKDTRLSSYTLEYALAAGLTASGGDAYIMHVTTTPSVSFATRCDGFDCGIMISASHNPYFDNGIKLLNCRGEKMEDGVLNLIENYIDGKLFIGGSPVNIPFAKCERIGRTVDYVGGRNRYVGHLISLSVCSFKGVKVGLDCANGSSYKIAKNVFDALGAATYVIGAEPDGLNVNEGLGATRTERLQELVVSNALDVGFAFDGDADRCICVDERGKIIDGDGILFILSKFLKGRGELLGDRIVATVMSNSGLDNSLKREGIAVERCRVGDRFVYEKMTESGAVLGGEQSGHIILGKLESTGDGLVTALFIMEALLDNKCRASDLTRGLELYPQRTVNIPSRDKNSALRADCVKSEVGEIRKKLEGAGRILVRPSGTEPVIRVTVESASVGLCEEYCARVARAVKRAEGGNGVCAE
ncbi:MAG: phosphoglucosamine mutase [Candidatus Coproplasma sp.]